MKQTKVDPFQPVTKLNLNNQTFSLVLNEGRSGQISESNQFTQICPRGTSDSVGACNLSMRSIAVR